MDNAQTREYKNEWDRAHKEDIKIRKRIRGALIKKALVEYKGGACSVVESFSVRDGPAAYQLDGGPLPHQLANRTRANLLAINLSP